eukprot:11232870-Ditylum_brightwellii.AAC.1
MAMSGNLKQPCFAYEPKFKHSEMEYVKLKINYDDGTKKTRKCQRFLGKEGIEGLLSVEDRFRSVATQLNFDQGTAFFDNWLEVLVDTAEDKWIMQEYCDAEAKDTVFEYLAALHRPTKVTPQDHSDQIKTMVHYANKLPRLSPNLTTDQ